MKKRTNCWEYKNCGREPGGRKAETEGVCPAAINQEFDGVNGGQCAGRFCWMIENTSCNKLNIIALKFIKCTECEFYQLVEEEENRSLVLTKWDHELDRSRVKSG
ncbi:MAG: hypothetical protein KJ950_13425 [Proteobacteria bacterium]|nr:hypothetical protein [Pseudomonadota bacterium]MBU1687442.1 hypothetical protein [Pseudomonadota bacterium]